MNLDNLKNRSNLIDIISSYTDLKKIGKNFIGLCPFHKETVPSLHVDVNRQIFYCFGCSTGGDIFSFLMKINNYTFMESVVFLAKRLKIKELPIYKNYVKNNTLKTKLLKINFFTYKYFKFCLSQNIGINARLYLERRGINQELIEKFQIGYAPYGWKNLFYKFKETNISLQEAEKIGLIISTNNNNYYDMFRGRLMFPIQNISGEIIAFGGRSIDKDNPKYLNSPESILYKKGKNLYGLYESFSYIREYKFAILVEGYFDLLRLWSVGIKNVVATLGTSLTEEQLHLLNRYTNEVIIIFDPDEAGKNAIQRALKLFLVKNINIKILILPENLDPDEYIKKYGKKFILNQIMQAKSLIDFFIDTYLKKSSCQNIEGEIELIKNVLYFVSVIDDTIKRNLFLKKISEKINFDYEQLKFAINQNMKNNKNIINDICNEHLYVKKQKFNLLELTLIQLLLVKPEIIQKVIKEKILNFCLNEELKKFAKIIIHNKTIQISTIIETKIDNLDLKEILLAFLIKKSPFDDNFYLERFLSDLFKRIKIKWYKNKHQTLKNKLLEAQAKGEQNTCLHILFEKEKLIEQERLL